MTDKILGIKNTSKLTNNINIKKWLRTDEAADYLGLSKTQIHNLKRNGTIPFTKLGGTIYFRRQDIDTVLEENYEEA